MNYLPNESHYQPMRHNRSGSIGLKLPAVSLGLHDEAMTSVLIGKSKVKLIEKILNG